MRKLSLSLLLTFILVIPAFSYYVPSPPSEEYLARSLDVVVDKTMEAYNFEDYIQFFEHFAKSMSSVTTKEYFRAVYLDTYKKELGELELKRLLRDESKLDLDFPVLVYMAKFEKYDMVVIRVNFEREHDQYKISYISFDKVYY